MSANSIGQTKHRYKYKLKLENTPSRFTTIADSTISKQSIRVFVSDFLGREIPFAVVKVFTNNLDTTFLTDVSGYLYIPMTENSCRVTISYISYNDLEIDTLKIENSVSTILKATLTLRMSAKICSIRSFNKLSKDKIKEIAKKFSANPFDTEIIENKTYGIVCQL